MNIWGSSFKRSSVREGEILRVFVHSPQPNLTHYSMHAQVPRLFTNVISHHLPFFCALPHTGLQSLPCSHHSTQSLGMCWSLYLTGPSLSVLCLVNTYSLLISQLLLPYGSFPAGRKAAALCTWNYVAWYLHSKSLTLGNFEGWWWADTKLETTPALMPGRLFGVTL